MMRRYGFEHLRGLHGWDLAVALAFEPIALLLLPVRAALRVSDAVREKWWNA